MIFDNSKKEKKKSQKCKTHTWNEADEGMKKRKFFVFFSHKFIVIMIIPSITGQYMFT